MKKSLKPAITSWEPINKRILRLNIKIYGRNIIILGA